MDLNYYAELEMRLLAQALHLAVRRAAMPLPLFLAARDLLRASDAPLHAPTRSGRMARWRSMRRLAKLPAYT
jgi:hypothetical protein